VGSIYDAAIDPELWTSVLEQICKFVPGSMANVFSQDAVKKTANRFFSWGADPEYEAQYLDKYAPINPLSPTVVFLPPGEPYSLTDVISHAEMRNTRLYKEWMEPQGYIDLIGYTLEKSATSAAFHVIVRHIRDGFVDAETRRRVQLVAPHLRRAILIGKIIDLGKVETAAFAEALDGLATAMFLVDSSARIVHANTAGHAMIAENTVIHMADGRMVAKDSNANRALRKALASAEGGDAALGVKGIALPLPSRDGVDRVAHMLPLTSASRRKAGVSYGAVAAIFVQKASPDLKSPLEAMSRRYGLTPGELRVLIALLNVGSVAEMAHVLEISEGTVRNHLHHLFEKTGTARQAELVKLVGCFASPLVA
jgi:DNA-binding CsgD family transcriptional regulator